MQTAQKPVGQHLRTWRQRRRLSQLDLELDAEISARHLSFVETGRATPSREMILHLCERLEVPWRERNRMLVVAGFAPIIPERTLTDPAMKAVRQAIDLVLKGHEPFPALAVDRQWVLVAANSAAMALLEGVAPGLLEPPLNVLRLSLHPEGLAPRIANLAQWRLHIFERLNRQIVATADPALGTLLDELRAYPAPLGPVMKEGDEIGSLVIPFRLTMSGGVLSFISTTMVFGTPLDVTSAELAIESFFPADEPTMRALSPSAHGVQSG
jgi:transcriptional regulator with XRE-family HTH domain